MVSQLNHEERGSKHPFQTHIQVEMGLECLV